jgi:uncharacterized protein (DUF608 family)
MPLGGIGAGSVQLMTDGAFSHSTVTNSWSHPTGDLPGCFGAIWTRSEGKTTARALELTSPYGLPGMTSVDFDGMFPQALMVMSDPQLPVLVSVDALSPFLPGDLLNSSTPGALYVVRLRNRLTTPVEVSIALSWENILGTGGMDGVGAVSNRTGDTVSIIPSGEGFYGLRFGSLPARETGEINPARDNTLGEMAVLALPPDPRATVTEAGWNALSSRPSWWDGFSATGDVSGDFPVGAEGSVHPAGVISVRFTLPPGRFVEAPFAVTWNMPHCYTSTQEDLGHYYSIRFPTAASAAQHLLSDRLSLQALTDEWQNRLLFSDLPRPLARTIINSVSPLVTHSVLCKDGRFALLEHTGSPESADAGSHDAGNLLSLVDRLAVSGLVTTLFPHLDAQELAEFATAEGRMGRIPMTLGSLAAGVPSAIGRSPLGRHPGPTRLVTADILSTSAFTIQLAQYVDWTGDGAFLLQHFRTARRAIDAILDASHGDLPTLPALPGGSADTLMDTGRPVDSGTATLWLAALRAAQRMAHIASLRALQETASSDEPGTEQEDLNGIVSEIASLAVERAQDARFEQRAGAAAAALQEAIERHFWNGSWYTDLPDTGTQGAVTLDSFLGVWASSMLEDPLPLNRDHVRATASVLNSLYASLALPPQRLPVQGNLPTTDIHGSESVLAADILLHTIPDIRLGLPEEGLKALEQAVTTLQNTEGYVWSAPARFQSDTAHATPPALESAMFAAGWYLNAAIEGMGLDLSSAHLRLTPRIPGLWRGLRAPLFAPTFWGRMVYRPLAHGYLLTAYIDRTSALSPHPTIMPSSSAALSIEVLTVPGVRSGSTPTVHVSRGNSSLGTTMRVLPSGSLELTLDTPVSLVAGDRLEVEVLE